MDKVVLKFLAVLFVFWFSFSVAFWSYWGWETNEDSDNEIQEEWEASYREMKIPAINCTGLPWCADVNPANPKGAYISSKTGLTKWVVWFTARILVEIIKYVPVIAVLALTGCWILLMTSLGNEEREKQAKKWMVAVLIWVVVALSGYGIAKMINSFEIWGSQTEAKK